MAKTGKKQLKKGNKNKIKNKAKLSVDKQKVPRHREKFAALNVKRQVKTRVDQLDMDYIDQLNEKEKAWLNSFLEETVITNFQHKGKKHYKSKKSKREFYNSNNARNRCMFTKAKAMGTLNYNNDAQSMAAAIDEQNNRTYSNDAEDDFIALIDLKRKLENS